MTAKLLTSAFFLCVALSIMGGLAVASAAILGGEPETVIRSAMGSGKALRELLLTAAFVSVPISIPVGLLGGAVVASVLSGEDGKRSMASWVARGGAWGLALGAFGTATWFGVINSGQSGLVPFVLGTSLYGGLAGTLVGSLAGACCRLMLRGHALTSGGPAR